MDSEKNSTSTRLLPVDALRGFIIVLMALDHANYFIAQQHSSGEHWGGPFPVYSEALPFVTRLVTHLSAPGFFFLMGVGMYLFAEKRRLTGWSGWTVIRHFVIRGAFLIVLQLLIVNRIWELGPAPFPSIYIGVLIALGGTMIIASLLLRFNEVFLIIMTLVLFFGTELLHPAPSLWGQITNDPVNLILLRSGGDGSFWANYPILPWLELVTFGLVFGIWLTKDTSRAYKRALFLSITFLVVFILVRFLNSFGNIRPQDGTGWIAFLNLVKYPPAMTFTLFTMGVNLLILSGLSRISSAGRRFLEPLAVFGRAPLFVYLAHLALYMLIGRFIAPDGSSLGIMYIFWIAGLLALYPLTLWYSRFKTTRPPNSLLRFL